MMRLALMLYSLIGTTLGGSAVVVALTMGHDTLMPIVIAAAVGFAVAIPVTLMIAKRVSEM